VLAEHLGWRWAFAGMALFGLLLALLYPLIVRRPASRPASGPSAKPVRALRSLFGSRSVIAAYVGSGLQLFVGGTVIVWMPSYLNRYYAMGTDRPAGQRGHRAVQRRRHDPLRHALRPPRAPAPGPQDQPGHRLLPGQLPAAVIAFPTGTAQLVLICLGMMVAAGTSGPSGAMVANLTHASVHGTAFATLTLANNLLGLATGPLLTGRLSDLIGLHAPSSWCR
jgi:MFS family permease